MLYLVVLFEKNTGLEGTDLRNSRCWLVIARFAGCSRLRLWTIGAGEQLSITTRGIEDAFVGDLQKSSYTGQGVSVCLRGPRAQIYHCRWYTYACSTIHLLLFCLHRAHVLVEVITLPYRRTSASASASHEGGSRSRAVSRCGARVQQYAATILEFERIL